MDLDKYANQYNNISREEIKKIRDTWCGEIVKSVFESEIRYLHTSMEQIKKNGRLSIRTQPLVQMLSVGVQPRNENFDKPVAIYGRIHAEINYSCAIAVHELYNRDITVAEILSTGRTLTLSGPDFSCYPLSEFNPLSKLRVMLFDGDENVFANEYFSLVDTETEEYDYEELKCKVIHCDQGSLTFRYVVIPFGASGRVGVNLFNKQAYKVHDFINVNGKISIRYADTYAYHVGEEECVLFEKRDDDFERIEIHPGKSLSLPLSRCWVALPPYSSIVVDVDLSEFGTMRKIANKCIELLPPEEFWSGDSFMQDDIITRVQVDWFSPRPFGRCSSSSNQTDIITEEMDTKGGNPTEEIEEMDTEGEDESSDDESDDSLSSNLKLPWSLRPHKGWLWPSPAVEIFSVFIGREKSTAVQTYGSIEVLAHDLEMCSLFKRDEKDALALSEDMKSIPISDGSRLFEHFISLGMKVDIKDVKGRLAIKGYVDWDAEVLDSELWNEKQICSLIQGQNGFAAVHYSIFSYAVGASIKVYCQLKAGCADEYSKVYGSLVAQYNCYDYSTRYNRDYYRIVLLKRTRDDSVQPSIDGTIPLSRSMVVVPSYSSLIVNVDLSFEVSGKILSCAGGAEIKICGCSKIIETADCSLRIEPNARLLRFSPCNVLLLRNRLDLGTDIGEVKQERLLTLVAERFIDSNSDNENKDPVQNREINMADAFNLLPRLATGIDVDIKFKGIDQFEISTERAIFDHLGIRLYHGWLVDKQDRATADAIGSKSYNTVTQELACLSEMAVKEKETSVEDSVDFAAATSATLGVPSPCLLKAKSVNESPLGVSDESLVKPGDALEAEELRIALKLSEQNSSIQDGVSSDVHPSCSKSKITSEEGELISNFLENNASQLTFHGLSSLQSGVKDQELCVLFRNNHFITMFKYEDELYLLITDEGYFNQPRIVWEKLDEVNGNSVFCDSGFKEFRPDSEANCSWDEKNVLANTADCLASVGNSGEDGSSINWKVEDNKTLLKRKRILKRLNAWLLGNKGGETEEKASKLGILLEEELYACLGRTFYYDIQAEDLLGQGEIATLLFDNRITPFQAVSQEVTEVVSSYKPKIMCNRCGLRQMEIVHVGYYPKGDKYTLKCTRCGAERISGPIYGKWDTDK